MQSVNSPTLVRINMKDSDLICDINDFNAISLIVKINRVVFFGVQSFGFNFNSENNFPSDNLGNFFDSLNKQAWWVWEKRDGQFIAINLGKIQYITILKKESVVRVDCGKELFPVDLDLGSSLPIADAWSRYKISKLAVSTSSTKNHPRIFKFDFEAADIQRYSSALNTNPPATPEHFPSTPSRGESTPLPPTPASFVSSPLPCPTTPRKDKAPATRSRPNKRKAEPEASKNHSHATPIQRPKGERTDRRKESKASKVVV